MPQISLINEHTFVFILVIVIVIVFISLYSIVAPEQTYPYNFAPYPGIAPTSLPDPNRPTDNCYNQLTPCDSNGGCSACSLDDYECKSVSQEQAQAKLYQFNGINVPEGNWCLPKDNNPSPCNLYTGRYVWSYDPAFCAPATQCWKCECLYPSLFGDPSTGCTARFACQNDSVKSLSLSQPNNVLRGTECSLPALKGQNWDPTPEGNPTPQGDASILYQYTPYDQDKNGNPWFSCDCSDIVNNQYFAQLPGDPYTCHLEPCYKSLGSKAAGLINCAVGCSAPDTCSCSCDSPNVAMSPEGKYAGTCVLISQACGSNGYDKNGKACLCQSPSWERKCRNPQTGVNIENTSLPLCQLSENALGSECIDPCSTAQCTHGSYCVSCGAESAENTPICGMSDNNQIHAVCDCRTATDKPEPPFTGYNGPNCATACLPDGTVLEDRGFGHEATTYYNCNCCCSQNYKKSSSLWGIISYTKSCSGSDIYPPNPPPNPECSPASNCKVGS